MEYLTRAGSKTYHLFLNLDTVCKLWSTGGINQNKKNWQIFKEKPLYKNICTMCSNNKK
jgi:hypothetical protein